MARILQAWTAMIGLPLQGKAGVSTIANGKELSSKYGVTVQAWPRVREEAMRMTSGEYAYNYSPKTNHCVEAQTVHFINNDITTY